MFVYVIKGSHGMVKIGVSRDPEERLATLQTGSPHQLALVHATPAWEADPFAIERDAHATLARHRHSGEWFIVPDDMAVAAVERAAFLHRRGRPVEAEENEPSRIAAAVFAVALGGSFMFSTPVPFIVTVLTTQALVVLQLRAVPSAKMKRALFRMAKTYGAALAAAILLAFVAAPLRVMAAEMPNYDNSNYCKSISAFMKNNDYLLNSCLEAEKTAKSKIRRVWGETPGSVQTSCVSFVELGTVGTYQGLSGCLSMSMGNLWIDGKAKLVPASPTP